MEDDQQFCLRWNNHQSTLIQNFDTLLGSGTLVDCTLAAEGKSLKAHKVVLSACSPFFEELLSEHYDKHPVFILKDVKFKELKAMMDYMYRGEVNISQDQLAALLKAAESLQIKGLSESKTGGSTRMMDSRQPKGVSQATVPSDIPIASSSLTIEKNKVPRQGVAQGSIGDLPEDSASPQIPRGLSSREGSQSPTSRKRKRLRRRSISEDNSTENHEASNSSDMPQQMGVPALGITPVAEENTHADPTDTLGRSALMTQLTKPADEMLQLPLEKPEPNENLVEPKSEYLEDAEESVEDLTLDDDMNDLNEMEQDNNRAGPSHDPSQHPAGIGAWHVPGDRSSAGGVVGSVGAPGTTDEVFLAAQEAAQAHRDSQDPMYGQLHSSFIRVDMVAGGSMPETYQPGRDPVKEPKEESFLYMAEPLPSVPGTHWPDSVAVQNSVPRKKFYCPRCNSGYTRLSDMKTHCHFQCGKEPRYQCPYCTKKAKFSSNMFQTIFRAKNVIDCRTARQTLQKFPFTGQYEVPLRQLQQRFRPETKPPHAPEVRVRPTTAVQVPLLRSHLQEDVQHSEAHTSETPGQRGLRARHLSAAKLGRLNEATRSRRTLSFLLRSSRSLALGSGYLAPGPHLPLFPLARLIL